MRLLCLLITVFTISTASAQQGNWTALLHRQDGNNIAFTFEWKVENGKPVWYIKNAAERIRVDNITTSGDSMIAQMPVFESQFRFVLKSDHIAGVWIKRGAVKTQVMPFTATRGANRFASYYPALKNISGR